MSLADFGDAVQKTIYHASTALLYPVLVAALACVVWVVVELGFFVYEVWLRWRHRDVAALEERALRARRLFAQGNAAGAYKALQENTYSMIVVRFLYDLIQNYQMRRLPEKPLKLLQDYEYATLKRLEKTRILVRVGPMLGLMGTLIPLAPALTALADGDTAVLADNLTIAFSVTVLGLLIGGLAFMVSIVRDRMYAQDISDMEYLLELLEGDAQGRRGSSALAAVSAQAAAVGGEQVAAEAVPEAVDMEDAAAVVDAQRVPTDVADAFRADDGPRSAEVEA